MSSADAVLRAMGALAPQRGSLGRRLLIWYGAAIAIVTLGLCAISYVALEREVSWVDDQVLDKRFATLRTLVAHQGDRDYWLAHEVSEDMEGPRRIFVRVLEADGRQIIETPGMTALAPPSLFRAPKATPHSANLNGADGRKYRALVALTPWRTDDGARQVIMQIAADTSLDAIVYGRYARTLAVFSVVMLAVSLAIGLFLLRRLLQPLNRISEQIAAVKLESLDTPIGMQGLTTELERLVSVFNGMMTRLSAAYAGLRHYADNAAHELRTPVNKLRLSMEVALLEAKTPEQYQDAIAHAAQDCRALSHLIDRMLFLARATNKQTALTLQDLDLAEELENVRDYFEASAQEAGVALDVDASGATVISADRVLLQRAVTNLVANALSHTPAGGTVTLSCVRAHDDVVISVRDTGQGISEADLPHVFERFYRGDAARDSRGGRTGLGLAIVRGIAELHGGHAEIESRPGAGAVARLTLPVRRQPETLNAA